MTALLFTLSKQRIDFDDRQDGSFKKSTDKEREEKQLIANQAALEAAEFETYYNSLTRAYSARHNHELPDWLSQLSVHNTIRLINRPDKNSYNV